MFKTYTIITLLVALISHSQNTRQTQWLEDLNHYKTQLEQKHIDIYNTISKAQFIKELDKIKLGISSKTDIEIIIDLMRLTRRIGDGHTAVSLSNINKKIFPIEITCFNGNWRVIKASKLYENLLGLTLTKIDGIPIKTLASAISEIAPYVENNNSLEIRTGEYLTVSELLFGLGLTKHKNHADFTLTNDKGNIKSYTIHAIDSKTYHYETVFKSISTESEKIIKPKNPRHDYLWFGPLQNTNAVYINFSAYPSYDEMQLFGQDLLNFINANKSRQVVIDLRNNSGGDFFVGILLAYYLNLADSIDWKHGVYILIDKVTFSAATINATQYKEILNGLVVGLPTGSNPNGYQDLGSFNLPNSNLTITYSKRLFRIQEKANQPLSPDVLIDYKWDDFKNGFDTMLEWIINDILKQ